MSIAVPGRGLAGIHAEKEDIHPAVLTVTALRPSSFRLLRLEMASNLRRTENLQSIKARGLWLQDASGTAPPGSVLYSGYDGRVLTHSSVFVTPTPGDFYVPGTLLASNIDALDISASVATAGVINSTRMYVDSELYVNEMRRNAIGQVFIRDNSDNRMKIYCTSGNGFVGLTRVGGVLVAPGILWSRKNNTLDIAKDATRYITCTDNSGGRVGINMNKPPSYTLDVAGNVRAQTNADTDYRGLVINNDSAGSSAASSILLDGQGGAVLLTLGSNASTSRPKARGGGGTGALWTTTDTAGGLALNATNGDVGIYTRDIPRMIISATGEIKPTLQQSGPTNQQLVSIDPSTKQLYRQPLNVTQPATYVRYVACGVGGPSGQTLLWSENGTVWNGAESGWFDTKGYHAAHNGVRWVAVGQTTSTNGPLHTIKVSTDGKNWTNITSGGFEGAGYHVAWNGSMWVAGGSSTTPLKTLQWSMDGLVWNDILSGGFSASHPDPGGGYSITWTGNFWIAVGFDAIATRTIQRSTDGKNWVASNSNGFYPGGNGIASAGDLHIAVGGSQPGRFIKYSTDAVNWADVPGSPQTNYDIAYNGSRWVAVGGDGLGSTLNTIYYSNSGIGGWTPINSGGFSNTNTSVFGGRTVIWDGTKWLAGGSIVGTNNLTTIQTSTDGIIWNNSNDGGFNVITEGIGYAVSSPIASLQVTGDFTVTGTKNFKIPHPLIPNTILYHAAIEGPRADLLYRGRAVLTNGKATVHIDSESTAKGNGMTTGTFAALATNPQVFVSNNDTWDRVKGSVTGGILTIDCESSTASATVDWMIVAERKDTSIKMSDITDDDGYLLPEHPAHP